MSVFGGPGHRVDVLDVVSSWLDPTEAVVPEEELFAPDQTEQEVEERNSEAMVTSQENATAAAMVELGITELVLVGGTSVIGDQVPLVLGPLFAPD